MFVGILLMGSLFVADNQEFINAVEVDLKAGKTWTYVGAQPIPVNGVAIPVIETSTGNKIVYFVTK
tara:strand:+ start:361 stop:558 length:198 start_codon:yes stop_codon:yes gene_type:complete